MQSPYTSVLSKVHWQIFCTLTFSREGVGQSLRERMFFHWLRQAAAVCRVPFRKVLWCRRTEHGEVGGRLHFHCLIGRLPQRSVHPGMCFKMMRLWEGVGGGYARVRKFNSEVEGPGYLLKGLSGEDAYESSKTVGGRPELMLSRSLVKMVAIGLQDLDRERLQHTAAPIGAV